MAFLQKLFGGAPQPAGPVLEEVSRDEWPCPCGCGRRWVRSYGRLKLGGTVTSFVVLPTSHGAELVVWMALREGPDGTPWTFIRSGRVGGDVAAGLVDATQSPLERVASPGQTAAAVRANQALKARVFAVHDQLLASHPDVRQLLIEAPEGRGRDYTFKMPDCVFEQPAAERSPRNQQNFAECGRRLFVRALVPVPVSDGSEFRLGVWLELEPEPFFHLMKVWDDEAAYLALQLRGVVETSVLLGGRDLKGETLELAPRSATECLFVASSQTAWVTDLMEQGVSVRDLPGFVHGIERSLQRQARA
jgi:hypothetical protein